MKAPNGNISNLTDAQWHLVRTPAFKAWFGDWENDPANASKVVDENGEPLVMYHGGAFSGHGEFKGVGWFTSVKYDAKHYSKNSGGNNLTTAFLNVKNPFFSGRQCNKFYETNQSIQIAIKKNNDGVIDMVDSKQILDVVVFNSNQIKLANGSNTTFDSNNPDVRFARGGQTSKPKAMTKLDELKNQIKQQLDLCDSTETPTICAIKETPNGYADIEKMVIEKVLYGPDPSIANAIVEIENTYNINSIDQ